MRGFFIAAFMVASLALFFTLGVLSCSVEVSAEFLEEGKGSGTLVHMNFSQVTMGSMQYLSAQLLPPQPLSNLSSLIFVVHPVFTYGINYTSNKSCWLPGNDVFIEYLLQNGSTIWVHHVSFRCVPVHVVCSSSSFEPLKEGYYGATSSHWLTAPLLPFTPPHLPTDEFQAAVIYGNISTAIVVNATTLFNELFQALKAKHRLPPPPTEVKVNKVMCREALQILAFSKPLTTRLLMLSVKVHGLNLLGFQVDAITVNGRVFKGSTAILPWTCSSIHPLVVKVLLKSAFLPLSLTKEVAVASEL